MRVHVPALPSLTQALLPLGSPSEPQSPVNTTLYLVTYLRMGVDFHRKFVLVLHSACCSYYILKLSTYVYSTNKSNSQMLGTVLDTMTSKTCIVYMRLTSRLSSNLSAVSMNYALINTEGSIICLYFLFL